MKSLQMLASIIVVAVSVSACSTTNTMTIPVLSGEANPNTGKYMPYYPVTPAPRM